MQINLNELAKKIIRENEYLVLATVDEKGKPWTSIMAYAFDEKYNFYYISLPSSKHSIHIKNNKIVSFSIFDSRQLFGKGVGLQTEGIATEIRDKEISFVENIYFGRKYLYGDINNKFMKGLRKLLTNKIYRFYQIEIITCWINDPGEDTDRRVKVDLY